MKAKKNANKSTMMNGPRLLPLKKAAEYIGLTEWAMRERIWSGQIPFVRFPGGRKIYIDTNDLLSKGMYKQYNQNMQ
jgi:hypothetical protein